MADEKIQTVKLLHRHTLEVVEVESRPELIIPYMVRGFEQHPDQSAAVTPAPVATETPAIAGE